ncbi:phage major tail tube protein [Taklimakanibacter albus]|uniref:Phage major tail tube protein n=1 Tax=Taklimakanibacter albus TaxID=2800327 RepID=A0ACC5R6Q1_9HYPH|nr:phage major tail tube protein [Aestuariivirga sp. YIM B02566]MBK1868248.1 phage major tail tube protein [Aestuariivirga sp. YIM B02566]
MALPHFVKQSTIIADGFGQLGKMESVKLPDLKQVFEDWRGGGMPGAVEVELGIEKMQIEFKIGGVDRNLLKMWGLQQGAIKPFQILGHAVAEDSDESLGVSAYVRGKLGEIEFDEFKTGSLANISYVVKMHYYRLRVGDEDMVEYDPINLVYKIGGVDQLAAQRANLGL